MDAGRYWACMTLTSAFAVGQIRGAVGERWIIGMVRYGIVGAQAKRQTIFLLSGLRNPISGVGVVRSVVSGKMHGLVI